ncbi:MAG: deoxyribonuclease IV [Actinomycetota bacterium]|nr:MAG: deoxyribonuclease [Actinomycetota bacterium]MDO8949741.1 deoxyribonuclease IV [Actinomycetota bacterium]MDP3630410.1 deoxyribonuclease IV [Actinomycetota bacterium]
MLIGAHVGVGDGFPGSISYAESVGCEAIQVFAKSPRQWRAKSIPLETAAAFRERRAASDIAFVCTHTAYLINLGSEDDELWEKSWRALADELDRAALLGADATVSHMGTNRTGDLAQGAARIAEGITRAFEAAPTGVLLLENTAGAGTTFGSGPDEIGAVLSLLDAHWRERLGVCLDSCHAHAAGWDLSDARGWDGFVGGLEACCGPGRIHVVHANDSTFATGEHRDRHAWVGEGTIGSAGFAAMFADTRLANAVAILEMSGDVPEKDRLNVSRLQELRAASSAPGSSASRP